VFPLAPGIGFKKEKGEGSMNKLVKHTLTAFGFVILGLWTAPHVIAQAVAVPIN
jgi:hypothetical protein